MVPNLIKAMANSPALLQGIMPFIRAALGPSAVEQPLKELAILTTVKLNGCKYCTAQHTVLGKRAGLAPEKINATPDPASPSLEERERAVVRFAKEVTENVAASQQSLEELRRHFDVSQIAEFNLVVGLFNAITRFSDTFEVDLER